MLDRINLCWPMAPKLDTPAFSVWRLRSSGFPLIGEVSTQKMLLQGPFFFFFLLLNLFYFFRTQSHFQICFKWLSSEMVNTGWHSIKGASRRHIDYKSVSQPDHKFTGIWPYLKWLCNFTTAGMALVLCVCPINHQFMEFVSWGRGCERIRLHT